MEGGHDTGAGSFSQPELLGAGPPEREPFGAGLPESEPFGAGLPEKESIKVESLGQQHQLNFSEVLHLLSRKVILGKAVPEQYISPPWRLRSDHPLASTVNPILDYSTKVQSGHIPGSEEFSEFVLSNSSLAIAGLLQFYLSLLEIESQIIFGILEWEPQARSGPDDYAGTPHVWLSVGGEPVDNAHVAFPPGAQNTGYFYECKKMNSYLAENPLESKLKLYLGEEEEDEGESREILRHNLRMLSTYSYTGHVEKYLVTSLLNPELNPGLKVYHILMTEFLRNNFAAPAVSMEDRLAKECWACRKQFEDEELLKSCAGCKIGKYCDRDCQRQGWKVHRLLHQEVEHTKNLLKKNEEEEEEETDKEDAAEK